MGNQLSIFTHTNRGNEIICGTDCHIRKYEVDKIMLNREIKEIDTKYGKIQN